MRNLFKSNSLKVFFELSIGGFTALLTTLTFLKFDYSKPFNFSPPFEDASMLFRYANNLAHGGGIAWNMGQEPGLTDGATDLGFVLVLSGLVFFGINVVSAAALVSIFSVFVSGLLMYRYLVKVSPLYGKTLALFLTFIIFSGPVDRYIKSGFSPAVLALIYLSLVILALDLGENSENLLGWRPYLLGTLAGLAGWWRPEGFLFSLLFLAFSVFSILFFDYLWINTLKKILWKIITPYAILFVSWCVFRLIYFGHLLPTSAAMKAESGLHISNFGETFKFLIQLILPILIISLLISTRRMYLFIFILFIAIVSSCFLPISTTLNWWHRMQWPLVAPLSIFLFFGLSKGWNVKSIGLVALRPFVLVLACTNLFAQISIHKNEAVVFPEFTQVVAEALSKTNTESVRLATTEAGLIPLTIRGMALDTYGWNDYSIATTGGATLKNRLESFAPNIIVMHGLPVSVTFESNCAVNYFTSEWNSMITVLVDYADQNNMVLFRSTLVSPCDAWSIFLGKGTTVGVQDALSNYSLTGTELVER